MYKDLHKKRKLGSLVLAIDPARFGGRDTIRMAGTAIINQVRTHGDNVLFPGQPEYIKKQERLENGIPVSDAVLQDFHNWSVKLGVEPIHTK
jgi:ureidoglycolate dehydrogenase (NAD+)